MAEVPPVPEHLLLGATSSISVGGAWTKVQNRRKLWPSVFGKSLRQHEIQKMVRQAKELLVGSCAPGPE